MISVNFACQGSLPALVLTTTFPDEAAFLKVFALQIQDGLSYAYPSVNYDERELTPQFGKPYKEAVTVVTLSLMPVELED